MPLHWWQKVLQLKYTAWLVLCLAVISALYLASVPGAAQAQQASATPYPGPLPTYPTVTPAYPEPQTATFVPTATAVPTQASLSTTGAPTQTLQGPTAFPNSTAQPASTDSQIQSTSDLQANPQSNGPDPTYVPLPAITFQLPEQDSAAAERSSPDQTPTPAAVSQGSGGAARWVPLGVILVIWALLAGWFYLSFRRLG